ncbi:unnamed protein product [Ceutorhynchus assimilis]|uniref:Uncharacterized protein n=1 Tax=Ceutorhynchus assimilis TaxID=467358 RepID=A0A9N9QMW1_9CUCU|nr:unnamed protein product [Ceutorhynchus assimilis]
MDLNLLKNHTIMATILLSFMIATMVLSVPIAVQDQFPDESAPSNFQAVRQTLRYDNFQRVPAVDKRKKFAWEQFDAPDIQYNF